MDKLLVILRNTLVLALVFFAGVFAGREYTRNEYEKEKKENFYIIKIPKKITSWRKSPFYRDPEIWELDLREGELPPEE